MAKNKHFAFYLLICAVFLIITAPALFSEGMTMDGVLYASISRNMANGLGTFWKPHLAEFFNKEFYGHPPLALGLQSLWFKVFGDSIYVERFYSLFTYASLGAVIVLIWKQLTNSYKTGWIPLLFFFTMLKVSWACANNLLENTMSVFIALSILFYLKGVNNQKILFVILSGLFLFAASLTKGFVGLYVWGFPFFFWLFNRNLRFGKMAWNTALLIVFTVLPIALLIWFWPEASFYLKKYFNIQVMNSISRGSSVDSRFFIVVAVVYHAIPPLVISMVILLISVIKKTSLHLLKTNARVALPFILLALSGIIPLMVSMKQSGHYAITVYPYIAIAIGLILLPIITELVENITSRSKIHKVFTYASYGTAIFAIFFSFMQVGKLRYEKDIVSDCYLIVKEIGKDKTVNICPELRKQYNLHGYFARYGNVSLEASKNPSREFLIMDSGCNNTSLPEHYKEVEINTKTYKLYKRE